MKMYITAEAKRILDENGFYPWHERKDKEAEFKERGWAEVITLSVNEVRKISEGLIDKTTRKVLSELGMNS